MSIEELKALMDAVTMMSPVHYQAYKNYIKITDGDVNLSIKLANGFIESLMRSGNSGNTKESKEELF